MACEVAGIHNVLNPDVDKHKRIQHQLTTEADQAWKDTNDVLLSHQLRYDAELADFITETEKTLWVKCTDIWGRITCIAKTAHLSLETGLYLTLHIAGSLLTIPMKLCFCGVIPMLLAYCLESYSLKTWDPEGDGDYLLDTDAQVLGMLLRKLAHIEGGAPMDSHSPHRVPSLTGSIGSIGSGASLPLGGDLPCTRSETPPRTREWSSSSSSCSHCSNFDMGGHESEGSSGPSSRPSDTKRDDEANKSMSDHSAGEESDGNAEERDNSGQQDNAQEVDESSSDESHSETESSEVPTSEVAKSAIVESDSKDSKSSSDSDSKETMTLVPMPRKEGKEAKSSATHSSLLPFLDPKSLEEQPKIEWHKYARSLDIDFGNW